MAENNTERVHHPEEPLRRRILDDLACEMATWPRAQGMIAWRIVRAFLAIEDGATEALYWHELEAHGDLTVHQWTCVYEALERFLGTYPPDPPDGA